MKGGIGLLVMLIVATVAFFLLRDPLGSTWALIVSVIIPCLWFRINLRAGTIGLFKANIRSYMILRHAGDSHEEALAGMVRSRFPFSTEKQVEVWNRFETLRAMSQPQDQAHDLVNLVYLIFCVTHGSPPNLMMQLRFRDQIWTVYAPLAKKYGVG